jgi:uncharacterized protein with ATP-grasp and redox domains
VDDPSTPLSPLPLPEPIRAVERGTWAHSTVARRLPEIGRRVIAENSFEEVVNKALWDLIESLPEGIIQPLSLPEAPDFESWSVYVAPYLGQSWLEVPWFFAENYFYRRLIEATGYFQKGSGKGVDPFAGEKERGLAHALLRIPTVAEELEKVGGAEGRPAAGLSRILEIVLWGNQADLSLWPAARDGEAGSPDLSLTAGRIPVDDRPAIIDYLSRHSDRKILLAWITDNAGFELALDLLCLASALRGGIVAGVELFVKSHPTFVSDATQIDVGLTVDALRRAAAPTVRAWGEILANFIDTRKIRLVEDFYWTSPLAGWEMPESIRARLGEFDIVITKGDMNYRRLLGDRHWDFSTPFSEILGYFPAPLAALRVLKSELATGLSKRQIERLSEADPAWMTGGRWGTVQFYVPE